MSVSILRHILTEETVTCRKHGSCGTGTLISSEDGSVTLASVIVVLGLAVLLAFSGNISVEALRKQRLQNAADSIAYSTAVWAARGMNTVSLVNHTLGELTSFCVIMDALGGPHAENGETFGWRGIGKEYCDSINKDMDNSEEITSQSEIKELDQMVVNAFFSAYRSIYKDRDNRCSASIYDARVTLLYYTTYVLFVKRIATIMEDIGRVLRMIPPVSAIGIILEKIGAVTHLLADAVLAKVLIEMIVLYIYDETVPLISPIVHRAVYQAIPGISEYGHLVANKASPVLSPLIDKSCRDFKNTYELKTVVLSPTPKMFHLPLQAEPFQPMNNRGSLRNVEIPWKSNDFQSSPLSKLTDIANKVTSFTDKVSNILDTWPLSELLPSSISRDLSRIRQFSSWSKRGEDYKKRGVADNPAFDRLSTFYCDAEKVSQWVRSTVPPLESFRLDYRNAFVEIVPISNLSTYFVRWSYLYTLEESYQIRSGRKTNGLLPQMMVMKDFDAFRKGDEPWTVNANKADAMYAIIVAVQGKGRKAVFSDTTFKRSNENGDVAIAQAMFYNAGGRDADAKGRLNRHSSIQPQTGWDTLQWQTPSKVGEWDAQPDPLHIGGDWWRFNLSLNGTKHALSGLSQRRRFREMATIQLNWQAKLTPISKPALERLKKSEPSNKQLQNACEIMIKYNQLSAH